MKTRSAGSLEITLAGLLIGLMVCPPNLIYGRDAAVLPPMPPGLHLLAGRSIRDSSATGNGGARTVPVSSGHESTGTLEVPPVSLRANPLRPGTGRAPHRQLADARLAQADVGAVVEGIDRGAFNLRGADLVPAALPQGKTPSPLSPNSSPTLRAVSNQTVNVGQRLSVVVTASDPDFPAQTLTFSLTERPPGAGVRTVRATNAVIGWTPAREFAGTTNAFTLVARDNGTPSLSATQTFKVFVTEFAEAGLGTLVLQAGEDGCIAITLDATEPITNLQFTAYWPLGTLTNLTVHPQLPALCASNISVSPTQLVVSLSTCPGQSLNLTQAVEVAELCFTAVAGQPSAFVPLTVTDATVQTLNGRVLTNRAPDAGRVVVVGDKSLLEASFTSERQRQLVLYGKPGRIYQIESTTNLSEPILWRPACRVPMTGPALVVCCTDLDGPTVFYRAYEFGVGPTNQPPVVNAGPDQVLLTNTTALLGSAVDDGLPAGCKPLSFIWTNLSGPGPATFNSPTSAVTAVTLSQLGAYVFRLSVSDSQATNHDDVTVTFARSIHSRHYTFNADFTEGTLFDLKATNDQLQTIVDLTRFNYVWVPVYTKGTVVRLDADTGTVLGEYRTLPEDRAVPYASRTAIDSQGNCWIANERDNSVVLIANPESGRWIDKNHNGRLDTSVGIGDVRPWATGDAANAEDELIVQYVFASSRDHSIRHISVDRNDNLWLAGTTYNSFELRDGRTGLVLRSEPGIGRGGNGGFIDRDEILWSTGIFLRWDTRQPLASVPTNSWDILPGSDSWGMAKDPRGNVWVTDHSSTVVYNFNTNGTLIGSYPHGGRWSQGIAIDPVSGDVWIAHSHCGRDVGHLKSDGTFVGNVPTAAGPTGVAIDSKGRVWVSTTGGVVQRINPLGGPIGEEGLTPVGEVDLTSSFLGGVLWTYANFVGTSSALQTRRGRWETVYNSGLPGAAWGPLTWNASICSDGSLPVFVATSHDGLHFSARQSLTLENAAPRALGRYLRITVDFIPAKTGEGPVLFDLTAGTLDYTPPIAPTNWTVTAGEDFQALWPDPISLKGAVCKSAHVFALNPVIHWSVLNGPGTVQFDDPAAVHPIIFCSTSGIYTFRITATYNGETRTDDMTLSLMPYNKSPWVDAGPNLFARSAAETVPVGAVVRDDGLPLGTNLVVQWRKKFGPGTVTFGNAGSAATTANFSVNGIYLLEVSASDSEYEFADTVEVRVGALCPVGAPPGLVSWWQASCNGADHVSGNEAFLEGGATYDEGKVGSAFKFDGVNDRILVFANPTLDVGKAAGLTVEFWARADFSGSARAVLGWHDGFNVGLVLQQSGDSLFVRIGDTNGGVHDMGNPGGAFDGTWKHLALTYDRASGVGRIYINSALAWNQNLGSFTPQTSSDFYLGQVPAWGLNFAGLLDEISLYNRALDEGEISAIYNAGATGKCPIDANQAPVVYAGPDLSLTTLTNSAALLGVATDDGLPAGSALRVQWSQVDGPGNATFANANAAATTATFDAPGTYLLKLSADDSSILRSDLVVVRVGELCTVQSPPGLAAWWPGNGTAEDVVGGPHGRPSGGTSFAAGQVSQGFLFDGTNGFLRVPAHPNLDLGASSGLTVEFWAKASGSGDSRDVLGWHDGFNVGLVLQQSGDSLFVRIGDTNGGVHDMGNPGGAFDGTWKHLALTYDRASGVGRIYINSALAWNQNLGSFTPQTSSDFYLGQVPAWGLNFAGLLDEISLYNRALDEGEISAIYNAGATGKCPIDPNQAPVVYAGPDASLSPGTNVAALTGVATDDGLPAGSTLRVQWSQVDGPGNAAFANANAAATTATFDAPGTYLLKLSADDSSILRSDLVVVRVGNLCTVQGPPGLAAWWPGNGTAEDVVGGPHGRLSGGTSFAAGQVSQGFLFDGTNGFLRVPAHPNLDLGASSGLTVEFWAKASGSGDSRDVLGWHDGFNVGLVLQQSGDSLFVRIGDTNGGVHDMGNPGGAFDGTWKHLALTYDRASGVGRIYINSALAWNQNLGSFTPQTSSDFYLGQVPAWGLNFAGLLDEISLYNRALDEGEISAIYNAGATGKCPIDANQAPVVYAGPDLSLTTLTNSAALLGVATDDGLPAGSALRVQWSQVDGPGNATFANANVAATTATFDTAGTYLLKLSADDSSILRSDLVVVRVGNLCTVQSPPGLAAWWPGNGSAEDVVGGHHGLVSGGTSFASGTVSQGFAFDGTNGFLRVPAHPNLDLGASSGLTVEFWAKASFSGNPRAVLGWHDGFTVGLVLQQSGDSLFVRIGDTNGGVHDMGNPDGAFDGTWKHIAVTYDRASGVGRIYLNGALAWNQNLGSFTPRTSSDFYLGQVPGWGLNFAGLLDEVSLYNRALDEGEISAIYHAGATGKCPFIRNTAPTVFAGGDKILYLPATNVTLYGSVFDDGLPSNTLSMAWRYLEGPAPVFFSPTNQPVTTVTVTTLGIYRFQLAASDGELTTNDSVTVTVLPDPRTPPTVAIISPTNGAVFPPGASVTISAQASDADGPVTRVEFFRNGASLAVFTNGPYALTLTNPPLGIHTFTALATDSDGFSTTSAPVTIRVQRPNRPPVITSGPIEQGVVGFAYTYQVQASDADGDPLTYALTGPSGMAIDTNGYVRWWPQNTNVGPYAVSITVTDPQGASARQDFTLTVIQGPASGCTLTMDCSQVQEPQPLGTILAFSLVSLDNSGIRSATATVGAEVVPLHPFDSMTVTGVTTLTMTGLVEVLITSLDWAGNFCQARCTMTVYDAETQAPDAWPTLDIASPTDGAIITAPTNVLGTASYSGPFGALSYYKLEIGPATGGPMTEIARSSNSVVNGVLGRLDPTLLLNDSYLLRLTAVLTDGRSASIERGFSVAQDLKIGNFTLSFTDLSIPLAGIPITVARTYDTLHAHEPGDFGYGWRLEFRQTNLRTSVKPSGFEDIGVFTPFTDRTRVYVTLPGGKRVGFTFWPRPDPFLGIVGGAAFHPRFMPDPGVTYELTVPDALLGLSPEGGYQLFLSPVPYNPASELVGSGSAEYSLTSKDGMRYAINGLSGQLRAVSDPNDNTLTFTNDAIISSTGMRVTFTRDAQGRIAAVTDPMGRQIQYQYDALSNLVAVIDRETNTTQFFYSTDRAHYLTNIIDPLNHPAVRTEYDAQGRLVRLRDAAGNPVTLTHDLDNSVEQVVDALGNTNRYAYDDRGNVVVEVNALGGVTRRAYDDNNFMTAEVNALGFTNRFTYDPRGNKLTETDPLGNVTRYTYNSLSEVTSRTDPRGFTTTNLYDGRGNLLSETDALNQVTTHTSDTQGNLLTRTDPLGNVMTNAYDQSGHLIYTATLNANGVTLHASRFTYDANGNQTNMTTWRTISNVVETLVTTSVYDRENRLVLTIHPDGSTNAMVYEPGRDKPLIEIDALGRQMVHRYDERGNKVQTLYPDGTTEGYTYDARNQMVAMTNKAGHVTLTLYDALNRRFATVFPDGTGTTNELDAIGRTLAASDERGNVTRYGYDPNCGCSGRNTSVTNALGQVMTYQYDEAGNRVAMTDALDRTTRFFYDALGRMTNTLFADGTRRTVTYDALGRRMAETDQATNTTRFAYDARSRLIAVTNALNHVTRYEYDEQGRQTAQIDALNRVTRFEYERLGRRTKRTLPLGQVETYAYDPAGNMTNKTDFNGHTTSYAHDSLNRVSAKIPDPAFGMPPVTFSYDERGLRTNMTDASGSTAYRYDARSRLIEKAIRWSLNSQQTTLNYGYDLHGNLTNISSTTSNGVRLTYAYDPLNRLREVLDSHTGTTTYTYDEVGNLRGYTLPNNVHSFHEYDALNRLTNLTVGRGLMQTLAQYTYTVNPSGHRLTAAETLIRDPFNPQPRTISRLYAYDTTYRLTNETISLNSQLSTLNYDYDAVGNRLSQLSTLNSILSTNYGYDANDRLLSDTYDANGNTLTALGFSMSQPDRYDFENRLIQRTTTLNSQPSTIRIWYDGDGNRVAKTVTTPTNTVTTLFVVDVQNPTSYSQVLEEHLAIGDQPLTIQRTYAYGHALLSQYQLVAGLWTVSYYGLDGHGNTRFLTAAMGQITDTYDYDAFGNPIAQTGSTPNNFLFTTEQSDPDLGLYFLRARYQNTTTGRFWTMDTFEGVLGDPRSLHKYLYAYGNPASFTDPSGMAALFDLQLGQLLIKPFREALSLRGLAFFLSAQSGRDVGKRKGRYDALIVSSVPSQAPKPNDPNVFDWEGHLRSVFNNLVELLGEPATVAFLAILAASFDRTLTTLGFPRLIVQSIPTVGGVIVSWELGFIIGYAEGFRDCRNHGDCTPNWAGVRTL